MSAVLCAVTAIMGLVVSIHAIREQVKARWAKSWPTALGKIMDSRLREVRSRKGITYQTYILFEYSVNEISHRSDVCRVGANESSSSLIGAANKTLARYPMGADVMVYFNPENPTESVLEPGKVSYFLLVLGFMFLLSGVVGFFASMSGY
jgi:uncharacterized protein DUF3592